MTAGVTLIIRIGETGRAEELDEMSVESKRADAAVEMIHSTPREPVSSFAKEIWRT